MAANNSGQQGGSMNNPKQSGLSWSQPGGAKPVSALLGGSGGSSGQKQPNKNRETSASQSGNRKSVFLFAIGVVVGGLLTWSWLSLSSTDTGVMLEDNTTSPTGTQTENSTGSTNTNSGGVGALPPDTVMTGEPLVVPSPQSAGLSVTVSSVDVSAPTWVVVYETRNGERGNALGAALFFPEGGGDNTINLLRATTPGQTYLVGRHVDNGDKQFSLTNDQPAVNAAGNPVYVEFRTQ